MTLLLLLRVRRLLEMLSGLLVLAGWGKIGRMQHSASIVFFYFHFGICAMCMNRHNQNTVEHSGSSSRQTNAISYTTYRRENLHVAKLWLNPSNYYQMVPESKIPGEYIEYRPSIKREQTTSGFEHSLHWSRFSTLDTSSLHRPYILLSNNLKAKIFMILSNYLNIFKLYLSKWLV